MLFIGDDGIVSGGFRSILNYARINPGFWSTSAGPVSKYSVPGWKRL